MESDQENQGYNLRDSQENLKNKHFSGPGVGEKNCVLSYGICDVTHFLSSDLWETRVEPYQENQGYKLRDSQGHLRNKSSRGRGAEKKSAFYHTESEMKPTF